MTASSWKVMVAFDGTLIVEESIDRRHLNRFGRPHRHCFYKISRTMLMGNLLELDQYHFSWRNTLKEAKKGQLFLPDQQVTDLPSSDQHSGQFVTLLPRRGPQIVHAFVAPLSPGCRCREGGHTFVVVIVVVVVVVPSSKQKIITSSRQSRPSCCIKCGWGTRFLTERSGGWLIKTDLSLLGALWSFMTIAILLAN